MRRFHPETGLLLVSAALFSVLLFKHISYPLLWQDEAETAMFATRVLAYGYPKVHGERNVLYEFGGNIAVGVDEQTDAYVGTTWGHFYFAVPGVLAARRVDDFYAKTARLRLPFALTGAAGIAVWVLALAPVFRDDRRRAQLFGALFLLLSAGSVSLLLHLREARYYPLLVFLTGAVAAVHLRHRVFGGIGRTAYRVSLVALLLLVFHTFFAAYFFLCGLLALDALAASRLPHGSLRGWARRAAADLAPLLVSAVLVAPALVFFETFSIAREFSAHLGLTVGGYLENVGFFLRHFGRYELLVPAVVCHAAAVGVDAAIRRRGQGHADGPERRVAGLLAAFVVGYAAVTCANPLVYERYFLILAPAVTGVFLLDAFLLVREVPRLLPASNPRRAAAATAAGIALVVVASSGPRAAAVSGRLTEITQPFRGPLDHVIAYIAETFPRTEELVIATNYANHTLMYYLGSQVIVGTNLNNIVRERALVPDLVIPRRRWPRGLDELRGFLGRADYERLQLPARDTHFNNVPALSRSRSTPDVHRYAPAEAEEGNRLVIFRRKVEVPR